MRKSNQVLFLLVTYLFDVDECDFDWIDDSRAKTECFEIRVYFMVAEIPDILVELYDDVTEFKS